MNDMHLEALVDKIGSYSTLREETKSEVRRKYKRIELSKGDLLFKEGDFIDHQYFLDQGCMYFYNLKNSEEQVFDFFEEGDMFTDLNNFISGQPTHSFVKAVEKTVLYRINKTDLEEMYNKYHDFERFGRMLITSEYVKIARRASHMATKSNEDRYLRLVSKRPKLTQRVPQYLIASFLGITPVGLSKIRKRISRS